MATPWIDSSSDNSTKSCRLMKPRAGGIAVTTMRVSPASGSTSRCRRPALGNGTVTLASVGIGDVSYHHERLRRRQHGVGEGDRPVHAAGLILARERRQLWTVETNADRLPLFQRHDADVGNDGPDPGRGCGSTSIGLVESNSSHTVSARRNNAAGVAVGNENVRRRPSLSRLALTLAGLPPDLISAGGREARRGGGIFGGASAAAAGGSFGGGAGIWAFGRGGRLRRLLGIDLDPGLPGEHLRCRRHNLAGLRRCRGHCGGLVGGRLVRRRLVGRSPCRTWPARLPPARSASEASA